MAIAQSMREVFGYFQSLNLLALLHDLQHDNAARQSWYSGSQLCPIAHGLASGQEVRQLCVLGQSSDLEKGCEYAARSLGANPVSIYRFVRSWDENLVGQEWLIRQLEALWHERLENAEAVQRVLSGCNGPVGSREVSSRELN